VSLAAGDSLDFDFGTLVLLALAAIGTAVGSVARDEIVRLFRERWQRADLGILAVNLVACAVVGAVASAGPAWHDLLALGFAGGLSTWSSLAVDVAGAVRARAWGRVALHVPAAFAIAIALHAGARSVIGGAP
jgi:CrcB protein